MKLCTYEGCGEPSHGSRCEAHPYPELTKRTRQERGYNEAWTRLSKRARELQPWCSVCGATEDLTGDHLRWPAKTIKDVDVLCRSHNAAKGKAPRGEGLNEAKPNPGGKANDFTQLRMVINKGGGLGV